MSKKRSEAFVGIILAAFALAVLQSPAHADDVTLTLSAASGSPGDTITIDGTITNGTANPVYLNAEDFSFGSSSLLNGDVTDFLLNAPFSLAPGTNSGLIAVFTLEIAPGTTGGTYSGNSLDIIGGTDPSNFTDVLASSGFSVDVGGAVSTPEPATLILLGSGFLLAGLRRRSVAGGEFKCTGVGGPSDYQ